MMDELEFDDNCHTCNFDAELVMDEFHGTCFACGFSPIGSILDAMCDDFKMGR